MRFELATDNLADAVLGVRSGVDRVEICRELPTGGLTPPASLLRDVIASVAVPVLAMAQPTLSDVHDAASWRIVMSDAEMLLNAGASGIVFAAVTPNSAPDLARIRDLSRLCGSRETVFHRAFERLLDPDAALNQLADAGITRVLTSGRTPALPNSTFEDRLRELGRLVSIARGRLTILPCGGLRAHNVRQFLAHADFREVHSACRHEGAVSLDPTEVQALRTAIDQPNR